MYQNGQINKQSPEAPEQQVKTDTVESNNPTPTTNPLTDWEVYINDEFGFSFQYPASDGWTIFVDIQNSTSLKADKELWVALPGSDQIVLFLNIYNSDLTASGWWEQKGEAKFINYQGDPIDFQKSNTRINGLEAIVQEGNIGGQSGEVKIVVVNHKDYVYVFYTPKNLYEDGRALTIFNQILSTFEFIDTETTSDFECPTSKTLDCTPCPEGQLCPNAFPQYCAKGSPQYNFIIKNCLDIEIVGL